MHTLTFLHASHVKWKAAFIFNNNDNKIYFQVVTILGSATLSLTSPFNSTFQIAELEGLDQKQISTYQTIVTENNINGKVLSTCDLSELGHIMAMTFGDWQLFRAWVLAARNPGKECVTWYVCVWDPTIRFFVVS